MSKTAEAVRAGRLTADQAKEITSATYHAPAAEDRLLDVAGRASLRDLRDAARAARQATEDDAARHARIRRNRYLRTTTDPEGAFCLSMRGPASDGAWLLAALRPFHAGQFAANRAASTPVGFEATSYDALLAMAHAAHGHLPEGPSEPGPDRRPIATGSRSVRARSMPDQRRRDAGPSGRRPTIPPRSPLWSEGGAARPGSGTEQGARRVDGRALDVPMPAGREPGPVTMRSRSALDRSRPTSGVPPTTRALVPAHRWLWADATAMAPERRPDADADRRDQHSTGGPAA